jgi:hypothetical protein
MAYTHQLTITTATPVVVTNTDVFGDMLNAKMHTFQVEGASTIIAVSVANSPTALPVATLLDEIRNVNATKVTSFTFTVAAGTATISFGGVDQ